MNQSKKNTSMPDTMNICQSANDSPWWFMMQDDMSCSAVKCVVEFSLLQGTHGWYMVGNYMVSRQWWQLDICTGHWSEIRNRIPAILMLTWSIWTKNEIIFHWGCLPLRSSSIWIKVCWLFFCSVDSFIVLLTLLLFCWLFYF